MPGSGYRTVVSSLATTEMGRPRSAATNESVAELLMTLPSGSSPLTVTTKLSDTDSVGARVPPELTVFPAPSRPSMVLVPAL